MAKYKIGNNILANRLKILNNQIELNSLNLTFDSFKVHCKKTILNNHVNNKLGKWIG